MPFLAARNAEKRLIAAVFNQGMLGRFGSFLTHHGVVLASAVDMIKLGIGITLTIGCGAKGVGAFISQHELTLRRREWKASGKRVVLVAGAFDLLHPGHVRLLEQARSMGDVLVVAVQSDATVGQNATRAANRAENSNFVSIARPIIPAAERAEILAALAAVDYVVESDEVGYERLIKQLSPDVFVTAATSDSNQTAAASLNSRIGGAEIIFVAPEPRYSTSALLERIAHLPE